MSANDTDINPTLGKSYHKQEHHIPNNYKNRPCVDPGRATLDGPPYTIDAESICISDSLGGRPHTEPTTIIEHLADRIAKPNFHLEYVCRGCENWVPANALRPERAGSPDPVASCFGCWYGHLNGEKGDFARTDADAAFSAWASAKASKVALELKRAKATGKEKERLTRLIDKADARVVSAAKRLKRKGINPGGPKLGQDSWVRPLRPETREEKRRDRERVELHAIRKEELKERRRQHVPSPNCRNCRNWTENKALSGPKGHYGDCWVLNYATKASFFCADHNPM